MKYSYVTDNLHTLDASADCLPANTVVVGVPVELKAPRICDVWLDGFQAGVVCQVEVSPDGVRWFSGAVISQGQTIVRVVTLDAQAVRVTVSNSGGTAATVYAAVALAEWPSGLTLIPGLYIMQGPYITRIG